MPNHAAENLMLVHPPQYLHGVVGMIKILPLLDSKHRNRKEHPNMLTPISRDIPKSISLTCKQHLPYIGIALPLPTCPPPGPVLPIPSAGTPGPRRSRHCTRPRAAAHPLDADQHDVVQMPRIQKMRTDRDYPICSGG